MKRIDVEKGLKVIVLDSDCYKNRLKGKIGVISYIYLGGKVGVTFDDEYNSASSMGCFWFPAKSLQKYTKTTTIEREEIFMAKNAKVVDVQFRDSSAKVSYTWFPEDFDMKEGNLVCCHTLNHGIVVAKALHIYTDEEAKPTPKPGRELLCVVNTTAYDKRQADMERMFKLKIEMDNKVKQLQQDAVYAMLAKEDTQLAQLLKEFRDLRDSVPYDTRFE